MSSIVTYDASSLWIRNQRLQIVSGAFHYFRVCQSEWAERLENCRRGGLNTIETIVPWNAHEYKEGEFHFTGQRDLGFFLDLCSSLGLYAIVRPSPYICGEWDHGGLPSWLATKPHIAYRRANPVLLSYMDRWYDQLLPILVPRQIDQGGPIILMQVENEYGYFGDAQETAYMEYLRDALVQRGVTVPLTTCELPGLGAILPGTVQCANFGSDFRRGLQTLGDRQPHALRFVSELWLAWFDHWGGSHHTRSGRSVGTALKEVLAAGGHYNFYMWSGGTNFGYFGGRTTTGSYGAFITTSYDYDAPIGETGCLTEKYHECRLVNWLAQSMQSLFSASVVTPSPWDSANPAITVLLRTSQAGSALFLHNPNAEPLATKLVHSPTGALLPRAGSILIPAGETRILLLDVVLQNGVVLTYCTAEVFAVCGQSVILYGEVGEAFEVCLGDDTMTGQFVETEITVLRAHGVEIVAASRQTAQSIWILHGPDGLRYEIDATYGSRHVEVPLPAFTWESSSPLDALLTRTGVPSPCLAPLDQFGVVHGYGWYETVFSHEGGSTALVLPYVHDRATVFVNGERIGVIGSFADFAKIDITTRPGQNRLTVMVDDLGRYNFTSRLGERKGLAGTAFLGGREIALTWDLTDAPRTWQTDLPWHAHTGLLLRIAQLDQPCTVLIDDTVVYVHRSIRDDDEFIELDITEFLQPSGVILSVRAEHSLAQTPTVQCIAYDLLRPLQTTWTVYHGVVGEGSDVDVDCTPFDQIPWRVRNEADGLPMLYKTSFELRAQPAMKSVKLLMTGLSKGVAWLNGHALGRYWEIGPQTALFLPAEWLCGDNTLIVFDEEGRSPVHVQLIHSEHFL